MSEPVCLDRRDFLFAGAATVGLGSLGIACLAEGGRQPSAALRKDYPRKRIARLADLAVDRPVYFQYPWEHPHSRNFLIRTGVRCGGGVGPDEDVIAFNVLCTHQGGLLEGLYDAEWKVAGPCPLHLSTFDLTRYGMVVAGHGTQGLPQVVLEVEGGDVWATGVQGLIYGFADNTKGA